MNTFKRLLAILLVTVLIYPLLPEGLGSLFVMRAAAAGTRPTESYNGYLLVKNASHLQYLNTTSEGGNFRMANNISIDASNMKGSGKFSGTFDGNGYTITVSGNGSNTTADINASYKGIFYEVSGTVRNLHVVYNLDKVSSTDYNLKYLSATINDTVTSIQVGGIASTVSGTIIDCEVSGTLAPYISHSAPYANKQGIKYLLLDIGGIAGRVSGGGVIDSCRSVLTITPNSDTVSTRPMGSYSTLYFYELYAGGIAGSIDASGAGATIQNCLVDEGAKINMGNHYNTYTSAIFGGIFGRQSDTGTNYVIKYNLLRSASVADASGVSNSVGFVISGLFRSTVSSSKVSSNVLTASKATASKGNAAGGDALGYFTGTISYSTTSAGILGVLISSSSINASSTGLSYNVSSPTASGNLNTWAWTSDQVNSSGANQRIGLIWLSVFAPTATADILNENDGDGQAGKGSTITITPPYKKQPINPIPDHDPPPRYSASDVYYSLSYTNKEGESKTVTKGGSYNSYASVNTSTDAVVITLDEGVKASTSLTLTTYYQSNSAPYGRKATIKFSAPGTTNAPAFSPNAGESLENGLAITAASGTSISYTMSTDGSEPSDPDDAPSGTIFEYNAPISLDTINKFNSTVGSQWKKLIIKAWAVKTEDGKLIRSPVSRIEYGIESKMPASAPIMMVNGLTFDPNLYYAPGSEITFDNADGTVYYTTGEIIPTVTNGIAYNPQSPYKVPLEVSSLRLRALRVRDAFPDSPISDYTIQIKRTHNAPLFSMEQNQSIPLGRGLNFLLAESDLPPALIPSYYKKEGDDKKYTYNEVLNFPGDYYPVLEIHENPDFKYADYMSSIPSIGYKIAVGSEKLTDAIEKTYTLPAPKIIYYTTRVDENGIVLDEDGNPIVDITEIPHGMSSLPLSGSPGQNVEVQAWTITKDAAVNTNSAPVLRTFKFHEAVQPPAIKPSAAGTELLTLRIGDTVSLSSATSNAQIFYSLTGSPVIVWNEREKKYVPARYAPDADPQDIIVDGYIPDEGADQQTFEYQSNRGISVSGTAGGYFTITSRAVKSDMSPSEQTSFTYKIDQIESVLSPTATPSTSVDNVTTLARNSNVILVSPTPGAKIFYSLTGEPSVTYDTQTDSYIPDNVDTIDYSEIKTSGIPVDGEPGSVFTVYAVACGYHMKPARADSNVVTLTYKIADRDMISPPNAWPATSATSIATVELGSIITLISDTSGAEIYYSLSGTPDPANTQTTKRYENGVTVEGTPGTGFALHAIAIPPSGDDTKTKSTMVTFTYKIAELPVAETPAAMPKSDSSAPVTMQSGSVVTLQTATSGAQIFYSLSGIPTVTKKGEAYIPGAGTFLFDKSIAVSGNAGEFFVIRAIAVKDGMQNSEIATFNYQLPAPVQAVYATPGEGTVVKDTEVVLSTTTKGAVIYYETAAKEDDLENPVPNQSQVYSRPIKIESGIYISAMAVMDGVESIVTNYRYSVASQVDAPVPSIPSGYVVAKGTKLVLSSDTGGANIIYTKDGSDPTDESNTKRMYGSEIALDAAEGGSVSISAYATRVGMTPSEVISISYTISRAEDVITANPLPDSIVKPGDRLMLSTSITGAEIYCTTDGSVPTRESPKGGVVLVDGEYGETFIVRAIAATENTETAPYAFSYQVIARTPAPSASIPNGAVVLEGATVTLTASEGSIYYTTDGNEPESSGQLYTEPFKLTGSTVLKAFAKSEDKASSAVAEYIYTMAGQVAAPTASLPSGMIDVGSRVEFSTTTEGADIYYTTNGAAPAADNLRDCFAYQGPITISRPVSIRMIAVKQGMNASVINTVTYTVEYPAEEEENQEASAIQWDSDRLFLFDQFADSGEGPLFEDVVLRDSQTLTVVSASQDALPEGVKLIAVRERSPSAEDEDAVTRALEMNVGALYNINLVDSEGNPVQPLSENGVEIGIPIPEGYEDTIVIICRINDNGTVTAFPTRRGAGMLYAVVDHFSKYAVAVPPVPNASQPWPEAWQLWTLAAGAALAGAAAFAAIILKKRKKA